MAHKMRRQRLMLNAFPWLENVGWGVMEYCWPWHQDNSHQRRPLYVQDPGARRAMWNFIIDATHSDAAQACTADSAGCSMGERSVMLTTHSMEECEALCTRVGILDQV